METSDGLANQSLPGTKGKDKGIPDDYALSGYTLPSCAAARDNSTMDSEPNFKVSDNEATTPVSPA